MIYVLDMKNKNILFFDGVCGLCNRFVNIVIFYDKNHFYHFAPLQGETSKQLLPSNIIDNLNSIILWENGQIKEKSAAVFSIFKKLGGFWRLIIVFQILPLFLTDRIYDFIAKYRYNFFGKKEFCRIPTPKEREWFLP
ncbi:MAG: DUF393 domain-containing protein [Bdellovibrionaceae bacterium]|nr:DUF393 domain-containing protein [Pseudobdellovibrionaceae bacterium]